jgi:aminopeptidase YwaD
VSANELRNSGITALISGLTLTTADGATARAIVAEVERAALKRLETERAISADSIARGASAEKEMHIIEVWGAWYRDALKTTSEIEVGGTSAKTQKAIDAAVARVGSATTKARNSLKME